MSSAAVEIVHILSTPNCNQVFTEFGFVPAQLFGNPREQRSETVFENVPQYSKRETKVSERNLSLLHTQNYHW